MLKETVVAQYPKEPHPRLCQRAIPYRLHTTVLCRETFRRRNGLNVLMPR